MRQSQADFTYKKIGTNLISIVDLDQDNISVTNDIENVVSEICYREKLDPFKIIVIYQDSAGIWDGYKPDTGIFYPIEVKTEEEALQSNFVKQNIKY